MTGQRPPKSPPPPPPYFELPAGAKIEFLHRFCPRCGLNLVEEPPQSEADHQQADEIKGVADQAGISWVAGDLDVSSQACLERMVAPLTQAEKEQAKRNEQRWQAWQDRQRAGRSEQKDGESTGHEHFVPMIKRQFFEWISQFRRLF